MIFIAKRHIAAGEEVTDCYGIHHLSMPRNERLAALVRRESDSMDLRLHMTRMDLFNNF